MESASTAHSGYAMTHSILPIGVLIMLVMGLVLAMSATSKLHNHQKIMRYLLYSLVAVFAVMLLLASAGGFLWTWKWKKQKKQVYNAVWA